MFNINRVSDVPIYEQLITEIERYVLAGLIRPGEKLPSVRNLSVEHSVNPNTVQKAYTELERQKLCYSVPGSGRFIAEDAVDLLRGKKSELLDKVAELARELRTSGMAEEEIIKTVHAVYTETGI